MNALRKTCLIGGIALVLASAMATVSYGQLREQGVVLRLLWPFGRQQPPVPLAPESTDAAGDGERPLIAPFVVRAIDINTCTLQQLQSLPGVSAALGAHIFAGRPYRDYQDLQRDGVPLNVVQGLRGKVTFSR
jgi:DNA uptake protein ComE-like DNA-binding protein